MSMLLVSVTPAPLGFGRLSRPSHASDQSGPPLLAPAAGAEALGGLAAARQGTRPLRQERVIGPDGLPIVLRDKDGNPLIDARGNRLFLLPASPLQSEPGS